ncbi:MAG: hypothetical protein ACRDTT_19995, partial [Pseudonocardiaceae bacterium]
MAEDLSVKLEAIPEDAPVEEAARLIFPDDEAAQQEYVQQANALQQDYESAKAEAAASGEAPEAAAAALPVFVAVALPIIARCVINGLGAAGINEIITLVNKGQQANAESRVYAFVGGCIQGIIPWKWLANKLS